MKGSETSLEGVLIIEPDVFGDNRGFFMETYHQERYAKLGIEPVFVQDNLSWSARGTLRGLHYQLPHAQAKLVQAIKGEVFDVVVDIRLGSSTFGRWSGFHLSDENKRQLYVPEGFAHGFCVLSETALFLYKCSDFYAPDCERGINWCDPAINIKWPINNPKLSDKDAILPKLQAISEDHLPTMTTLQDTDRD